MHATSVHPLVARVPWPGPVVGTGPQSSSAHRPAMQSPTTKKSKNAAATSTAAKPKPKAKAPAKTPAKSKGPQGPGFFKQTFDILKTLTVLLLRISFHGGVLAETVYGLYYEQMHVKHPVVGSDKSPIFGAFKGRLKYFPAWNMILQAIYFAICLVNDVIGSNELNPKKKPLIRRVKDTLLASLAFPLAMFVGLTFWGLYAIDRELVFPKVLDEFFPTWLNHVMHTNIMVFTILEVITTFRLYPKRSTGLEILVFFMGIYLAWIHVIYYVTGDWVYPVCEVLNWWQRLVFFGTMILFCALLYFIGEFFNNKVWEKEVKQFQQPSKKGKKKN